MFGSSLQEDGVTEQTTKQLLEKWEYRMFMTMNSGGVPISEVEAEEIWYLLKELELRIGKDNNNEQRTNP